MSNDKLTARRLAFEAKEPIPIGVYRDGDSYQSKPHNFDERDIYNAMWQGYQLACSELDAKDAIIAEQAKEISRRTLLSKNELQALIDYHDANNNPRATELDYFFQFVVDKL